MSEVLAQLEKKGGGGGGYNCDVLQFDTNSVTGTATTYSYTVTQAHADKYKALLFVTRSSSSDNNAAVSITTNTIGATAIYQVSGGDKWQKSVFYADSITVGATFAARMVYNQAVLAVIGIY